MQSEQENLNKSPLGQKTLYVETYSPNLLFPIPRKLARDKIGITSSIPFSGVDLWSGFEISWLNLKGKPEVASADFTFPCTSPNVVESKSFKLYLNSFNDSSFSCFEEVREIIKQDLSNSVESAVEVDLFSLDRLKTKPIDDFPGFCLDTLDITTNIYQVDKYLLQTGSFHAEEAIYSDLLKSNCLATGQPDWGSVFIKYAGPKIDHEGLLKYIISFRKHAGFAEHCVEHIFSDILSQCKPKKLTVYCRYTRRGGLDINPFRSNFEEPPRNIRQYRQ
jgi:7-cyano-7-deazaguanine reductase